jgi:hypothetical protein
MRRLGGAVYTNESSGLVCGGRKLGGDKVSPKSTGSHNIASNYGSDDIGPWKISDSG